MADVNSNINIHFNTADALAQLRRLQAGLSRFHQSLAEGNLAAANAQKGLNAQLVQAIGATGKFAVSQAKVASSTLAFTTALEKNKLSLREYYRYSMAAATANTKVLGKAFAQEREIINRARRDRVKALQAQYIQMAKAQGGFIDAMRVMPRTLMMANGRFTELGTRIQYAAQRQQFLNQLLKQGSTSLLNFGKNTQWAGRQLMVGLTMPLMMLGGYASKAFRDLEKATVKFKRVYGDAFTNDAQIEEAVQNVRKLANEYTKFGVSVVSTMDMAATAAAAGFQGQDLLRQVDTATKLAVLGQIEQQQALETTISLQNAFGLSSEQLAEKINFLNAVENQTVLSIEDLTIAIPKAAPVVKQLGGTVEDLAFFLTAMKEGGINASEGANALKSGLASLINPTEKASKMLGEMGINIKGIVEANKGDIKGTVVGFARALDTLDPLNRARAIEQLFGKFQFARLSTLFQNVSKDGTQAARAFDLAGASVEELAVLSEREMKKVEDAVGTKFQAAVEKFKQDIMPLGKAFLEAVTPIVKFFGKLFEKFNGLGDQTKKVIAIIVGVVAGLGPILLMTFGLLANGLANLIKLFATIRGGIAKLNGQTNVLGAGFNYVTQEQLEQQAAGQALHNTHTRLTEVFNVEKVAALQLAAAYQQMATQMNNMAKQNPALFAGGLRGAKGAVSKLPKGPTGFEDGIVSVPGPKGAGDIVPAMVSPGEAIIPADKSEKYRGLITAMFQDKVPGFITGKLPGTMHPAPSRIKDLKMPKSFAETQAQRAIAEQISKTANAGKYGKMKPTDFGQLVEPFKGYSFPVPGVGGVYRQKNGQLVVVKPTMNPDTAQGDIRSNKLTSLHGINTPKSKIAKIIDPTDPEGKRSYVVLVSKYDKKFSPQGMTGKFTKSDMIKQLVASSIRGDKDLQMSNVSGRNAPDPSNAYIFPKGSGFREIATAMPSMEQMALINTLAVKGGAKKFFAQQTASLASKMSPKEYDDAIKNEIKRVLPLYKKEISSGKDFQNLNPLEKQAYANVIARLEAGLKTDWTKVHSAHIRAGGQVPKYKDGVGDDATKALTDSQKKKLVDATFKHTRKNKTSKAQIDKLARSLNKDASEALKNLKKTNPEQYKKSLALLAKSGIVPKEDGSINLKQTDVYRKFLKTNLVYKDGEFHTRKAIVEKGQSAATSGRSYDDIRKQILYRMGAIDKNGSFSNKGFTPSQLHSDLTPTTQSGGWRSNIPKNTPLYKALDEAEKAHKTQNAINQTKDPLGKLRQHMMQDLGYTAKQTNALLRTELSHISKTGEAGLGPAKWQKGFASFDLRLLNSYVNPGGKSGQPVQNSRLSKILAWNEKNNNAIFPAKQAQEFKNALRFLNTGNHPVTEAQVKLVREAARAQILADDYLQKYMTRNGGKKPGGFPDLGSVRQAKAVAMLIDDRLGTSYYKTPQPVFDLRAGVTGSQTVLAKPGEFLGDSKTQTAQKLTVANTGSRPRGAVSSTGKSSDNRTVKETQTQRVMTRGQVGRSGFVMTGRDKGDPTLKNDPEIKRRMAASAQKFRSLGYSSTQMQTELARIERRLIDEKRKELARGQKDLRRKELNARTEANLEKKNASQQSQSAKLQSKINAAHTEALAMNKQFDKDKKMQARQMRQEKVSRFSGGASMALGTAGMAAMMSGNTGMGMGLMGASAVAGMAPMFAGMGPVGWITTAAIAVGGSLFALNKHLENGAKKQAAYVASVSATTDKMEKIGAITNKVGASRAMEEVRSKGSFNDYNDVRRAGTRFGDTFLQSDVGKQMAEGFVKNMQEFGSKQAAQNFGLQLATYISDGVLTAEQASSIAEQIGVKLGSRSYTVDIIGNMENLVGPNGEDLKNNALEVRTKIIEEANKRSTAELSALSQTGGRDSAARIASLSLNNIEIVKAQADATEWQYRKQIQVLQKQLEQTTNLEKQLELKQKIADLEGKMATESEQMGKLLSDQINAEMNVFEKNIQKDRSPLVAWLLPGDDEEDAYFDGLKSRVQEKFKDTFPGLTAQLQKDLSSLSDRTDLSARGFTGGGGEAQKFEVLANLTMGQGFANPQQFKELMDTFAGKEGNLYKTMRLGFETHGPQKTMEMLNFFTGFENKDLAVQISTDIMSKDPEQFDKIGKAIAQMAVMDGHEINMEAFIKTNGIEGLEKLSNDLDKIEKIETPITKEAIAKLTEMGISGVTQGSMQTLMSQWKDWDALPDVAKKEAISKYKTVYDIVFASEEARIEWARKIAAEKAKAAVANIKDRSAASHVQGMVYGMEQEKLKKGGAEKIAAEAARTYVGEDGKIYSKDGGTYTGEDKGGTKEDPYQFLLQRLKNVRNAGINAAGGIKALNAALADKGIGSAVNKFEGISQQLDKIGTNRQFTDFIMGLDPKDQGKYFKTVGSEKDKKGRLKNPVTGKFEEGLKQNQVILTELGKKYRDAFDLAVIGDFNDAAQRSVDLIRAQDTARTRLLALKYDELTITKLLQDENLAIAIANGKATEEDIRKNAVLTKEITLREKINSLIQRGTSSLALLSNRNQIPDLMKFFDKLKSQGAALSTDAIKSILGDPELMDEAIAAMEQYNSEASLAPDILKRIVDGLNSIKEASNIKLALEFATSSPAQQARTGFEAAQKIMKARTLAYSNMNISQLSGITTAVRKDPKTGQLVGGKNIGQQAIDTVNARYAAAGLAIPKIEEGQTLKTIQSQRVANGKILELAQQRAGQLQGELDVAEGALSTAENALSAAQDRLESAQDNLDKAIDAENKRIDDLIKAEEDKIESIEKKIQVEYEDKIDALNKESDKLSNDLAIMDHAAEAINEKYDKQIEALQKVKDINQDIAAAQQQQLGLADALSQGDIAAAAKAAQEMRASQQERMANAQMSTIEEARKSELGALRGAETGMTREQISQRQFEISQAIYKIENDPERLKLEQQIKDLKENILKIEEGRAAAIQKIKDAAAKELKDAQDAVTAAEAGVKAAEAKVKAAKDNLAEHEKILKKYADEEERLKKQEEYYQSIVDAAEDIDDSAGLTLKDYEDMVLKLESIEEMAKNYALSMAGAETAAANSAASWASILETLNSIPTSVETESIINEIRNITENITRYITTIDLGSSGSSSSSSSSSSGTKSNYSSPSVTNYSSPSVTNYSAPSASQYSAPAVVPQPGAAWIGDGAGGWRKPTKPEGNWIWDDNKGWIPDPTIVDTGGVKTNSDDNWWTMPFGGFNFDPYAWSSGGLVPTKYFANGGFSIGTDTVPAMLTPGEFVMSRYAVDSHGLDKMKAINNGDAIGDSVYNYSISVNVKSDANPDEIARAVMAQIKQVDSKKLRGARL